MFILFYKLMMPTYIIRREIFAATFTIGFAACIGEFICNISSCSIAEKCAFGILDETGVFAFDEIFAFETTTDSHHFIHFIIYAVCLYVFSFGCFFVFVWFYLYHQMLTHYVVMGRSTVDATYFHNQIYRY